MIMGASTFPGVLVRGSRMRFATSGRGLGDLLMDCEGPHPNCSPLDQACVANWQNIVSSCQPIPAGAGITRQLSTSSPRFAAQLAAAGGDEMLALQAQGNPVLPSHPAAAWWGGPGASVAGNPSPHSSSHHNPGATPTNPIQQQVRINPTNLPIRPLHPRPPLRGGYGNYYPQLQPGVVIPGYYSSVPVPMVANGGMGRLGFRRRGMGQMPALEVCNQSTVPDQNACSQRNNATIAAWAASPQQRAYQARVDAASAAQAAQYYSLYNAEQSTPTVGRATAAIATPQPIGPATMSLQPWTGGRRPIVVRQQPPAVVNPSPATQRTNTGSSQASPTSVVNVSSGCVQCLVPGPGCCGYVGTSSQVSTVGGTVSGSWFTDASQDLITGLPNWALLMMAAGGLYVIVNMAAGRR